MWKLCSRKSSVDSVNTSILNRVVVGENSKVGMGSVVTHNVPAATLVYGVPARIKDHNTM